jgi:hypothetical protein
VCERERERERSTDELRISLKRFQCNQQLLNLNSVKKTEQGGTVPACQTCSREVPGSYHGWVLSLLNEVSYKKPENLHANCRVVL